MGILALVAFSPLNRQSPALEEIQMREREENKHKRWAGGREMTGC